MVTRVHTAIRTAMLALGVLALLCCSTTSDVVELAQNEYLVRARMDTSAIREARVKAEQYCFERLHAGSIERPVDTTRTRAELRFSCGGDPEFRHYDLAYSIGENNFFFRLNMNNPQLADTIASTYCQRHFTPARTAQLLSRGSYEPGTLHVRFHCR